MPWPKCELHKDWDAFDCPVCEADHQVMTSWIRKFYQERA